jgi:hypothetical protein
MPTVPATIPDRHDRSGAKVRKLWSVTGPSSYATGGEALDFGLGTVEVVLAELPSNGTDLRAVRWDYTNSKLKWFDWAGAEIAAATDLSTYSARLEVIGH